MPDPLVAVTAFAESHGVLVPDAHLLVAVSGGPDSAVLLHAFHRLARKRTLGLTVAHFHHGVRPNADADMAFVREHAETYGLPFVCGKPVLPLAGDEASMRDARYSWLATTAEELGATHIAVGHTRDDQVETILLRLVRGAGLDGLSGMRASRPVRTQSPIRLVRPLLDCSRDDILAYAQKHDVAFVTDETNLDTRRTRNRLRHEVLPLLRRMQPGLDAHVAALAERLRADAGYLHEAARSLANAVELGRGPGWRMFDRAAFLASPLPLASRVTRLTYGELLGVGMAPDAQTIDGLMEALRQQSEGAVDWPQGIRVRWNAAHIDICVVPAERDVAAVPLPVPGEAVWTPTAQRIIIHEQSSSDVVPLDLRIRGWRSGDRWRPAGHPGEEAVSETLRAMGVPFDRRPAAPVLAGESGVWWVVGARPPAHVEPEMFARSVEVAVA